jgi:hypothetical protein
MHQVSLTCTSFQPVVLPFALHMKPSNSGLPWQLSLRAEKQSLACFMAVKKVSGFLCDVKAPVY